jgi:hypothetical protein
MYCIAFQKSRIFYRPYICYFRENPQRDWWQHHQTKLPLARMPAIIYISSLDVYVISMVRTAYYQRDTAKDFLKNIHSPAVLLRISTNLSTKTSNGSVRKVSVGPVAILYTVPLIFIKKNDPCAETLPVYCTMCIT